MEAYENYINHIIKLANANNIDLSGFNAKFSKSASEMINSITGVGNAADTAEKQMDNAAQHHGDQHGADAARDHGATLMEGQNDARKDQSRREKIESPTDETLDEAAKNVDKPCIDIEITEKGEQAEKQTDDSHDFPADGFLFRHDRLGLGCLRGSSSGAGSLSGGFLLCHNFYLFMYQKIRERIMVTIPAPQQ